MPTKMYPDQDHTALGELYIRHVEAMTAEGLHAKSDIAEQLAWRDGEIARLKTLNAELVAALQAQEALSKKGLLQAGPGEIEHVAKLRAEALAKVN